VASNPDMPGNFGTKYSRLVESDAESTRSLGAASPDFLPISLPGAL
jgi:hypothetical protein